VNMFNVCPNVFNVNELWIPVTGYELLLFAPSTSQTSPLDLVLQ
jgi:hypothetical protein